MASTEADSTTGKCRAFDKDTGECTLYAEAVSKIVNIVNNRNLVQFSSVQLDTESFLSCDSGALTLLTRTLLAALAVSKLALGPIL